MIKNLDYLRTALEVLESGSSTEVNTIKILRIMSSICTQNADRLELLLVDNIEDRLYNSLTVKGASDE
jgi:Mn-dependent DtxR family transcriptional regulator